MVLEILDVSITHSNDNVLGPIKHGYIRARGVLGPVVWGECTEHSPWMEFREIRGRRLSWRPYSCKVFMDDKEDGTSGDAVYLPIIVRNLNSAHPGIQGLLLIATGKAKNEYRRITTFSLGGQEAWDLMMRTKTRNGTWRSLPRRTFTLV